VARIADTRPLLTRAARALAPVRAGPRSGILPALAASPSLAGSTVLLLDDPVHERARVPECLAHHGARPVIAADVDHALTVLSGIVVDAVLLSESPDALALSERLESEPAWASTPKVITTRRREAMLRRAAGHRVYVAEPIVLDRLLASVALALRSRG
jgi:DNA-binding response OmpR family regulator